MKKLLCILLAVAMMFSVFALTACNGGDEPATDDGPDGLTFGWSVYDLANPFFVPMDEGVHAKAAELGINMLPTHDNRGDATEMITGVTALIAQDIDALVISPFSPPAMGTVMAMAEDAGIPVVVVDIGTGGAPVDAYIMSDMRGGGRLAGEYFLHIYDSFPHITSSNVAIIKVETAATFAVMRGEGFKDAVEPAGFTVLDEQHGNSSMDEAYVIMLDYIARFGDDLAAVFAENDQMALGAAAAIDEAGLTGDILVFGFDGNDDAIDAIKEGKMHGTAAQDPRGMGALGVELAFRLVNGENISALTTDIEPESGAPLFWSAMSMIGVDGVIVQEGDAPPPVVAAPGITFGWSVYDLANPFFVPMDEGVQAKAAELGINLLPTHDNRGDATEMITGVTALIAQGIDALVISPFSPPAMGTVMAMAEDAGIPVVVVDIGTGGAPIDAYIMSDMRGGGRLAGEYFLEIIGDFPDITSTNVAIIKVETAATFAVMRGEGFKDAVVPAGFTVLDEQHGNSSMDEAYAIMVDYIARFGNDLAAVFAENDQMALGAAAAIDEAGLTGQILVFGFDGNDDAIDAIREGKMHGTAAQDPRGMGALGVELALRLVNGEDISGLTTDIEPDSGAPLFWSPMAMIDRFGNLIS